MEGKEYMVTFTTGEQISPDDWRTVNPSMKVNGNTTVKEIESFFRKWEKVGRMEVRLIELNQTT